MLRLDAAGYGKRTADLGPRSPVATLGREPGNELSIDDPSISRRHGQFLWSQGQVHYEDLGSHNGSRLDGVPAKGRVRIHPGSMLQVGDVRVTVQGLPGQDGPIPEETSPAQWIPVQQARKELSVLDTRDRSAVGGLLKLLQDISLDLLHDDSQVAQTERVLRSLGEVLQPGRVVALLRDPKGEMVPLASVPASDGLLPVSRTAVRTLTESRQALLIQDRTKDLRVRDASSLLALAVRSLMAVPMESEGNVEGMLYAEAGFKRDPFDRRDLALLATVGHMLAARIRTSRLLKEQEQAKILEKEMTIARKMQQDLLPDHDPACPAFTFLGRSIPRGQVSGDLYGYWFPSDRQWYAAIADVAGKGVGPGLLMACLVAYMNAFTQQLPAPEELAAHLSRCLAQHTSTHRFATAFLCALDPEEGWIEYTNAGHNPGLLVRGDGRVEWLHTHGLPLASFPGLKPYASSKVFLDPGDLLFLYTDGITEATDAQDEEFGEERLSTFLVEHRALPLEALLDRLQERLERHVPGAAFGDDRTMLAIRRTMSPDLQPAFLETPR